MNDAGVIRPNLDVVPIPFDGARFIGVKGWRGALADFQTEIIPKSFALGPGVGQANLGDGLGDGGKGSYHERGTCGERHLQKFFCEVCLLGEERIGSGKSSVGMIY